MPGVSLVQSGARGGVTSVFVRGGNSNFNKVLVDGIPANDIGGSVDLSQFSVTGIDRVEALRDPNSVVFGSDALSGVISLISRRGRTPVPQATLAIDGGNLGTNRESAAIGGAVRRFDYFSELSHLGTDNDVPNNKYRDTTYAGRFGGAVGRSTDVSGTIRWIDRRFESPNGIDLSARRTISSRPTRSNCSASRLRARSPTSGRRRCVSDRLISGRTSGIRRSLARLSTPASDRRQAS